MKILSSKKKLRNKVNNLKTKLFKKNKIMRLHVRDSAVVLSKLKQKNYELITENNSYNKFIARWKWHLKNLFPFLFGKILLKQVDL